MKNATLFICLIFLKINVLAQPQTWIRINQLGYLTTDVKAAVLVSKDAKTVLTDFQLCDALTEQPVFSSKQVKSYGAWAAFTASFRLNFSDFKMSGSYFIKANNVKSPIFRIGNDVYDGTADFLLRYMRQQRCGFNPSLRDSCHTAGGYVVYGDPLSKNYQDSAFFPIYGGWHDASDYLQYAATTATATFQLLFAYQQHPSVFRDDFQANGLSGKNGIPDILDEAKWGLDWLVRLNPEPNVFFNQVCDDRDHRGMRMPNRDTFTYDIKGSLARPVYRVTGKPQGLGKYKNRTTGVASTAGKFSSAFAAGARTLKNYYPKFADSLREKAINAYEFGKSDTGVCQTAPNRAPYFYEEDDWADDMELAATQLHILMNHGKPPLMTSKREVDSMGLEYKKEWKQRTTYLKQAEHWAYNTKESRWMGTDTARHYQWYPFINLGHYPIFKKAFKWKISASSEDDWTMPAWASGYYGEGIDLLIKKGKKNPFQVGTPFIWCSNNYVSAAITQMKLYGRRDWDSLANLKIETAEAAHRDWLFGCNPWGTSMIYGLPNAKIGANTEGVSPRDPHSAFTHYAHLPIDGGLVDGPLYGSIFGKLIGITLYEPDEFAAFQSPLVVYHDDYGDYSTNEPTMDGTASLAYYLAAKEAENRTPQYKREKQGAITRLDSTQKTIHLSFTGHDYAEGGDAILTILKKHKIPASFFLTGDFLRKHTKLAQKIKNEGHFVGAHSDKHLLYADWQKRDSTLVSRDSFWLDLKANFNELNKLGIQKSEASVFMPPYEWYNDSIALWTKRAGLELVNFTSGTSSNADYTTPEMSNYKPSKTIYDRILTYEKTENQGLNGFILLLHMGVGEKRKDKFWTYLEALITELKQRGYQFERF